MGIQERYYYFNELFNKYFYGKLKINVQFTKLVT